MASDAEPDAVSVEETEDRQPSGRNNNDEEDADATEGSIAEEIATEDSNDFSNSE